MMLTSVITPDFKNDNVKVRTYAHLEDLSAAEMRDLWNELKKPYISPPEIMEQIRADVLEYLHSDRRTDLVAVCMDNVTHMEDKKRL